jgi:hypothetical protein
MPPKKTPKKGAEAKKGAGANTGNAQAAEESLSQAEEEETEKAAEAADTEEESDKAESSKGQQQRQNMFEIRTKALGRLPKDGSKRDKKHKLLFQSATDIIQTGHLKSNPCVNCKAAKKECFVPISDLQADGGSRKCAFCVWGELPCSVGLFRALEPVDS